MSKKEFWDEQKGLWRLDHPTCRCITSYNPFQRPMYKTLSFKVRILTSWSRRYLIFRYYKN